MRERGGVSGAVSRRQQETGNTTHQLHVPLGDDALHPGPNAGLVAGDAREPEVGLVAQERARLGRVHAHAAGPRERGHGAGREHVPALPYVVCGRVCADEGLDAAPVPERRGWVSHSSGRRSSSRRRRRRRRAAGAVVAVAAAEVGAAVAPEHAGEAVAAAAAAAAAAAVPAPPHVHLHRRQQRPQEVAPDQHPRALVAVPARVAVPLAVAQRAGRVVHAVVAALAEGLLRVRLAHLTAGRVGRHHGRRAHLVAVEGARTEVWRGGGEGAGAAANGKKPTNTDKTHRRSRTPCPPCT